MRLNLSLLALHLLLDGLGESLADLVGDVVDVSAASGGADAVDKTHLLELAVGQAAVDFPPRVLLLLDLERRRLLLSSVFFDLVCVRLRRFQVQVDVVVEGAHWQLHTVQEDADLLVRDSRQVVSSLGEEVHMVLVDAWHLEDLQVWVEGDASEVPLFAALARLDLRSSDILAFLRHVLGPGLLVAEVAFGIACLHSELG